MSVTSEDNFQENDVVWAKLKGYPWWPARIYKIENSKKRVFSVNFLGEDNHASLSIKNILAYEKNKKKLESGSKKLEFKIGVGMADNIIKNEFNDNINENCDSPKSDLKEFKEHFDDLKKSVREENNSIHQDDRNITKKYQHKELRTHSDEKIDQGLIGSIPNLEYKNENENDSSQVEEKYLNKKRKRSTDESSLEMRKEIEDQDENQVKSRSSKEKNKNSKSPSLNDQPIKKKRKLKSYDTINIRKDEIFISREIDKPLNPDYYQSNGNSEDPVISNIITDIKNYPPIISDLMIVDSQALSENSKDIFKSHIVSLKLAVDSFSRNTAEIISTVENIDDFTNKSNVSGTNSSEDILETFCSLKESYLILLENSKRIPKIVKNSIDISKRNYSSLKFAENSSLIEDIEKFIKELSTESDNTCENDSKISKVEINEIQEGNASLSKYSNLWKFMKSILTHEFNCVFESQALSSIKNFHEFVINGNYLKEEIQKLKKISFGNASEKKREKTKIKLEDILSKSVKFISKLI
jgi:hypothetical protein